jgi:formate dehydrogenase iron-sulfur subunit
MKVLFVSKKFERTTLDLSKCDPGELIMMVDLDRCISCGSCELACQIEHGEDAAKPASVRQIRVGREDGGGIDRTVCLPLSCRHCGSPCDYYSRYNFWITCPSDKTRNEKSAVCDFCVKRTEKGLWPACATRCTMKAVFFGTAGDMLFALEEKRLREMGDVRICG